MEFKYFDVPGVVEILPRVFGDARGAFFESFSAQKMEEAGIVGNWVQDNQSRSDRGVVRGLHFQQPPHAQAKLVHHHRPPTRPPPPPPPPPRPRRRPRRRPRPRPAARSRCSRPRRSRPRSPSSARRSPPSTPRRRRRSTSPGRTTWPRRSTTALRPTCSPRPTGTT